MPYICPTPLQAISVGGPDNEVEPSAQNLPTSPTGGRYVCSTDTATAYDQGTGLYTPSSSESPEVVVECWMGKKEGQKVCAGAIQYRLDGTVHSSH